MADPILEQIAIELESRLDLVTTDQGYNYSRARVIRRRREGYSPEHLLIVMDQGDAAIDEENSVEGNPYRLAWVQAFNIALFVKPTDDDTEPIDAIINRFRADVEKAVAAKATWHTMGGLALVSNWGDASMLDVDDGSYEGIVLTLNITYRVSETNPYAQG